MLECGGREVHVPAHAQGTLHPHGLAPSVCVPSIPWNPSHRVPSGPLPYPTGAPLPVHTGRASDSPLQRQTKRTVLGPQSPCRACAARTRVPALLLAATQHSSRARQARQKPPHPYLPSQTQVPRHRGPHPLLRPASALLPTPPHTAGKQGRQGRGVHAARTPWRACPKAQEATVQPPRVCQTQPRVQHSWAMVT